MNTTPTICRRALCAAFAALAACALLPAHADTYPSKPIRLLTPNSAGSGVDNVARRLAERLGHALGQTVYVDNVPGAGGVIGTEQLVRAAKDGYTISVVSSNHVVFPHLYKNIKFDVLKDLTSVAIIGVTPLVLVARSDFAANDAAELAALAKKKPGALTMASSGSGTILHLVGEQMQNLGGFKLTHVPYKGVAPALPDLVSGVVDVGFFGLASVDGLIKQGRLKVLGVSGAERIARLPNAAPIGQAIAGFEIDAWFAVIGPGDLPADVATRLNHEVNKLVADESFKTFLAQDGTRPRHMSQAETRHFIAAEYDKHGKIVAASGATVQ